MKIYVRLLFFSEHRKMKEEKNLGQILIFSEKWKIKICGQFSFFFFLDS